MTLLVNFIGFQVGWFACVLGAANDKELLGMIIALGFIIYHVVNPKAIRVRSSSLYWQRQPLACFGKPGCLT